MEEFKTVKSGKVYKTIKEWEKPNGRILPNGTIIEPTREYAKELIKLGVIKEKEEKQVATKKDFEAINESMKIEKATTKNK